MIRNGIGGWTADADLNERLKTQNQNITATNTAQMAEEQQRSNELAEQANMLLAVQTKLALMANTMLGSMCDSMDRMVTVTTELLASSARQEGLQQQQLDVAKEQLDLHRRHYTAVERERDLKELIFQMEKFSGVLDQFADPVAKGYWATQQTKEIERRGFSTKDITDLNDKRLFDQLLGKATAIVNGTDDTDRAEIDQYTMAQTYLLDLQTTADSLIPPVTGTSEQVPAPPVPPSFRNGPWSDESVACLRQFCSAIAVYPSRLHQISVVYVLLLALGAPILFVSLATGDRAALGVVLVALLFCLSSIWASVRLGQAGNDVKQIVRPIEAQMNLAIANFGVMKLTSTNCNVMNLASLLQPSQTFIAAWEGYVDQMRRYSQDCARQTEADRELAEKRAKAVAQLQKERKGEREKTVRFMTEFVSVHPGVIEPSAIVKPPTPPASGQPQPPAANAPSTPPPAMPTSHRLAPPTSPAGGMPPTDQLKGRQIGRVLNKMGKVTREQVVEALNFQKSKGGTIGRILIDLGYIKELDLNVALAAQRGIEIVNLEGRIISHEAPTSSLSGSGKCPQCGAQVSRTARKCGVCGMSLEQINGGSVAPDGQ